MQSRILAVRYFFQRETEDPDWHPGKTGDLGPPTQLTGQMRHAIAKSMMAKKKAKIRALLRSFALRVAASGKL